MRWLWFLILFAGASSVAAQEEEPAAFYVFDLESLSEERAESGRSYNEFLRVASMFAGIYELEPGEFDRQTPHDRDELYVVSSGIAKLDVGGEMIDIKAGSIIYVARDVEHRFVEIEEAIRVLVFFAENLDR